MFRPAPCAVENLNFSYVVLSMFPIHVSNVSLETAPLGAVLKHIRTHYFAQDLFHRIVVTKNQKKHTRLKYKSRATKNVGRLEQESRFSVRRRFDTLRHTSKLCRYSFYTRECSVHCSAQVLLVKLFPHVFWPISW